MLFRLYSNLYEQLMTQKFIHALWKIIYGETGCPQVASISAGVRNSPSNAFRIYSRGCKPRSCCARSGG